MSGNDDQKQVVNDNGQEGGDYAGFDDSRLQQLAESGEIPEDPAELEALLNFDSNSRGKSGDDATDADKDDGTGGEGGSTDDTSSTESSKQDDTSTSKTGDDTGGAKDTDTEDPSSTSDDKSTETDDKGAASGAGEDKADDKGKQTATDDKTSAAGEEEKPAGVATRDGKHTIPYEVLESERRGRRETEQENERLRKELEELRTTSARTETAAKNAQGELETAEEKQKNLFAKYGIDTSDLPMKDDGTLDVESLRGEYPEEVVNILGGLNKVIGGLHQEIDKLNEASQRNAEREQALFQQATQDDIDATPGLAELQSEGGVRWNTAKSIDRELRADPAWQKVSQRVRFSEVVNLMKGEKPRSPADAMAALGKSPPPKEAPPKSDPPATDASGSPQERAAQRLAEEGKGAGPKTHSDLPAGEKPPQDGLDQLESMDVTQLEDAFERTDDPDALINKMLG